MKLHRKYHNRKAPIEDKRATDDAPTSVSPLATTSTQTVGPKDVTSLVEMLSRNLWYPNSIHFRRHFNALIRFSLTHMHACGDSDYLSRLVSAIPDKKSQMLILSTLTETFPIRYLPGGKQPKFRKDSGKETGGTWDIEHFDIFKGSNHAVTETAVILHRDSYERHEALDLMLDVLTTYRNDFSSSDVQQLEQTLMRIKERTSKPERLARDPLDHDASHN